MVSDEPKLFIVNFSFNYIAIVMCSGVTLYNDHYIVKEKYHDCYINDPNKVMIYIGLKFGY
jgi:hypothetical protein